MPETTAATTAGATKPKRQRNPLNKVQAAEVSKAEKVGLAAKIAENLTKLEARRITAPFIQQLLDDVQTARGLGGAAVSKDTTANSATINESALTTQLLSGLAEIQSAARQEFYDDEPQRLKAFYSGVDLHTSRDLLTTMAQGILTEADGADLPGITATKLTAHWATFSSSGKLPTKRKGAPKPVAPLSASIATT